MVRKWCYILLCLLSSMLFLAKENENEKHYYNTFVISSKYAVSHSIYVHEEENDEGYFLLEDIKTNFKKAWNYLDQKTPSLLSVVLFDVNSELSVDQRGQGVEIAVQMPGRIRMYTFATRYILKRRSL